MSKAIAVRHAGIASSLVLAALAVGIPTAGATTIEPVRATVNLPIPALLPNLTASNPSPGTYQITNNGIASSGSFVVRIHRVGVKAGASFIVPSLSRGQSFSRYIGNYCGGGLPPAFEVIADSTNLVHESNETDNTVVLRPTANC
jgi:subtilase family serine protease